MRLRPRTASAATCASCSRRSPIGTISSPWCCRTGRTSDGSAGSSISRRPALESGGLALDLATGTGDIAFRLASSGWNVVGLDVTRRMIELARSKAAARRLDRSVPGFLVGDMLALPFPARVFDVVTAGYGLRNVPDLRAAIDEMHRVLKNGGQVLSLDFNRPSNPIVRGVYLAYLKIDGRSAGLGSSRRRRHVSIHSRVDSQLSRGGRGCPPARGPRLRWRPAPGGPGRSDDDPRRLQERPVDCLPQSSRPRRWRGRKIAVHACFSRYSSS